MENSNETKTQPQLALDNIVEYMKVFGPTIIKTPGMSATIGEDGTLKQSYKPVIDSQQALVQAREGNLPSYAGMDPQDVIALMSQRQKLDRAASQLPQNLSSIDYQNAMTNQVQQQPQNRLIDIAARFAEQARDLSSRENIAKMQNHSSPITLGSFKAGVLADLYQQDPERAVKLAFPGISEPAVPVKIQLLDRLTSEGLPIKDAITLVMNPAATPERIAAGLTGNAAGNIANVELGMSPDSMANFFKGVVSQLAQGPSNKRPKTKKKISNSELSKVRQVGEVAKIRETQVLPIGNYQVGQEIPGIGTVSQAVGKFILVQDSDGNMVAYRTQQ